MIELLLHWQFHVAWSLADEVHLPVLTNELCHWRPTPLALTVRPDASGRWRPDWPDPEPDPPPPTSVGWLTWHLIWWWTEASAVRSDPRPARYTLAWVNAELMKNIAEIGAVRHLWAASRDQG